MNILVRRIVPVVGCVLIMTALGACSEDVAAPSGVDEPFSVFGILNPRLETQTVAVSPIEPLLREYPSTIDARVTSTDLQAGEVHVWRDTVVAGTTENVEHIYTADFRPKFGSSHRIEVERSDAASTSVVADIPMEVEVYAADAGSQIFEVVVEGRDYVRDVRG